jgi:hypothetical protein
MSLAVTLARSWEKKTVDCGQRFVLLYSVHFIHGAFRTAPLQQNNRISS